MTVQYMQTQQGKPKFAVKQKYDIREPSFIKYLKHFIIFNIMEI